MPNSIYQREFLKQQIRELNIITYGLKQTHISKSKIPIDLKEQIVLGTIEYKGDSFSERIFWILNDIFEHPVCCTCQSRFQPRFYGIRTGYHNLIYCSNHCCQTSEREQLKRSQLYFEKTGYTNPFQNPEVKKKIRFSYKERTGYDSPSQNPEVQKKMKKSNLIKRGVEYPTQSPDVLAKRTQNYLDNTGYAHHMQNPQVVNKIKENSFELTGFEWPLQNPEIQAKCRQTLFERTGCYYALQMPELFEKQQRFRTYTGVLPSGKEFKYQGAELIAITKLLETYSEEELVLRKKDIPTIWYLGEDGKDHRYFADIYIPKDNLIIEVKSCWTYGSMTSNIKEYTKNRAKRLASIEAGFDFQFWICDNEVLVDIIMN